MMLISVCVALNNSNFGPNSMRIPMFLRPPRNLMLEGETQNETTPPPPAPVRSQTILEAEPHPSPPLS